MNKQLYLSAPICYTGYGIASYNILNSLKDIGYSVDLHPIGNIEPSMNNFYPLDISRYAPSVRIWHQYDVHPRIGKGKHFGFPIFELDRFTTREKRSMYLCDHIITCSEWAADIVRSHVTTNVSVVPLGVDNNLFSVVEPSNNLKTIFLNVGKWEIRKGHDFLIKAFKEAFSPKDPVELWLLPHNPFLTNDQTQWWLQQAMHPKIRVFPRKQSHNGVYELMKNADVGVFPARAEGWNLELLEMMAIGKHVITTNYSAHTEFCNKDNCNLIDIERKENAYDGIWFNGEGAWAELDNNAFDQLIHHMRSLHKQKQESGLGVNTKGVETGLKYSWANSAQILSKLIE